MNSASLSLHSVAPCKAGVGMLLLAHFDLAQIYDKYLKLRTCL